MGEVRSDGQEIPELFQVCTAGRCPALTTTRPDPVNHFLTFLPPLALPAGLPHPPPPHPARLLALLLLRRVLQGAPTLRQYL